MVDNSNIKESEYLHFIEFAQQEHYIASVVTLPAPHDLEIAAQRSTKDVTVNELNSMLSMYEPTSLAKLSKKGAEMHDAAQRGMNNLRVSPRRDCSPTSRGSMGNQRRSSSHFREIPADTIPENADAQDEQDSSEEEAKAAGAQVSSASGINSGAL